MLINVKMPTIVGILTYMSRINFVLSLVEHKKVLETRGLATISKVEINNIFDSKIVNIFLPISLTYVLGAQRNCSFEYPQYYVMIEKC